MFSLEFWVYEQKWALSPLRTNLRRAAAYQRLLDNIPLGDDPKSKEIREVAEYWIEFERYMRPFLSEKFVKALTMIIKGEYDDAEALGIDWHYEPVA